MTNNTIKNGTLEEEKFEKYVKKPVIVDAYQTDKELEIETLEGTMRADIGDYIIKGVHGEPYPCKPDIFHKTYSKTDETKQNLFAVAELSNGIKMLVETKTNYILPVASLKAVCILLNYAAQHNDVPEMEYHNWWEDEKFQKYYQFIKNEE